MLYITYYYYSQYCLTRPHLILEVVRIRIGGGLRSLSALVVFKRHS